MGGYQGSVPRIQQSALKSAEYSGLEAVAEIGRDDSDQIGALFTERTGEIVGPVRKPLCRFDNPLPRFFREPCGFGHVVENHGDRRSRQTKVLGQLSQRHSIG
jgi:hypothetical protein